MPSLVPGDIVMMDNLPAHKPAAPLRPLYRIADINRFNPG
jgi:hypothetical protein